MTLHHTQPEESHDHWTWTHEPCGYGSPFFWHTEEDAQTSFDDHLRTCRKRLEIVKGFVEG